MVYSHFGDMYHIALAALPVVHALQVSRGCTQRWFRSLQVDHNLENGSADRPTFKVFLGLLTGCGCLLWTGDERGIRRC